MANDSYEEVRRKRVEENKKKLDELKLQYQLVFPRPKPSLAKQLKRKAADSLLPVRRRSGRIANPPEPPVYIELFPVVVKCNGTRAISKRRDLSGLVFASDEARTYAIEKAEEMKAVLGSTYPSLVKPMHQSHTTGPFWLGLPPHFCMHLPKHDSTMVLVDEDGNETDTTYIAHKIRLGAGLGAGWKGFSINHELVDGDALVFQLIKPTVLKVYIIRARSYDSNSS